MFSMEKQHEGEEDTVGQCSCKKLGQSSLQQDFRMLHRPQQLCYRSCNNSSGRKSFHLQAIWLGILWFCLLATPIRTQEDIHNLLATTASSLDTTFPSTTYSPTFPTFNMRKCMESMDTLEQGIYVCREKPELFYLLTFAEAMAKRKCEEDFKHELWNCSGFSILKEPKLTKSNTMYKESAYVYSISLVAIAHTVALACSRSYSFLSDCGCENGESGCPDNVNYALNVAETFLSKRYEESGLTLTLNLIHHNFAAAKQHVHYLVNNTNHVCLCYGVSGTCTMRSCLLHFPSFNRIASALKAAYENACQVRSNGHSRITWVSKCNRTATDMDLLYRENFSWCAQNSRVGSTGTEGRECIPNPGAPNSCQKLCGQCGLGYKEHYMEQVVKCDCQLHFCCEIVCKDCVERRTYYACSSS